MRKLLCAALVLALLLPFAAAMAGGLVGPGTMYVYTENGKSLNVRSTPRVEDNIIGHLQYGAEVHVTEFQGDWVVIEWGDTVAYVQGRFLQWYKPKDKPQPDPEEKQKKEKREEELASEKTVDVPFMVTVVATRTSGFINVRKGPSTLDSRVESCPDGTPLEVIAETDNWYRIKDQKNGKEGYIFKTYTKERPAPAQPADAEAQLGTLSVNGVFTLQCKLPEGYKLDVLISQSSRIVGSVIPDDATKPHMLLTVAYDEMFSDKERLNDLTDEEIETLKASFTDLNDVEFSEMETSHGTKLLVAKETGDDADFVDFISLYKGYSVEFVFTNSPDAANQTLTDDQIQMCVDFLSDLDFVPAA